MDLLAALIRSELYGWLGGLLIIGAALRQHASRGPDTVSGGKQHAVDDVDHDVRLKNVGGAELGRAALGVAHIPAAILLPDGELGALHRGAHGLADRKSVV